jgi:hypothetical protein
MRLSLPSVDRTRHVLVVLWITCFMGVMLTVGVTYAIGWIDAPSATASAEKLSKLYAPYVGSLVAYSFAVRKRTRKAPERAGAGVPVALAGSLLWNLPILLLVARHLIPTPCEPGQNCIEDTVPVVVAWGEYCGIVAGPALGFYFGMHH